MKTTYEGQEYEIYGEPTPAMIADFQQQGLGIKEDWEGELRSVGTLSFAESATVRMRTYEGFVGTAALALSRRA